MTSLFQKITPNKVESKEEKKASKKQTNFLSQALKKATEDSDFHDLMEEMNNNNIFSSKIKIPGQRPKSKKV